MKHTAMIFVALLLSAIAVDSAIAQVIFSTGFSAAEGYVDGPLIGQPASGTQKWIDANPNVPADSFNVENEMLAIIGKGSGGKWALMPIPVQKGVFTMTWDWRFVGPENGVADIGVCVSDSVIFEVVDGNPVPNYNEQGMMVRFYTGGVVEARDGDWAGGGTYGALREVRYQDGKLLKVRVVIDASAWTFDVYITKEGESEILLADDYGFRQAPSEETGGLNCIVIWDNGTADMTGNGCTIDNLTLFGPAPVPHWSLY